MNAWKGPDPTTPFDGEGWRSPDSDHAQPGYGERCQKCDRPLVGHLEIKHRLCEPCAYEHWAKTPWVPERPSWMGGTD